MKAKSLVFIFGVFVLMLSGCAASLGPGYGYGPAYYPPRPHYYGYGPRTEVIVAPAYRGGYHGGYHGGYGGRGRHWR